MGRERPFTGLTAEIKLGGVPIGYMSGIELSLEKDIIEVLQFGAKYREKVPAIKNWTASADGTVAFAPGGSQHKLYQAFENDEEVVLGIFLNDFVYFEGKAYVSSLSIDGAPDDKMNIAAEFEGNGATILNLPITYVINANSGVGGTLVPGGAVTVAANGTYEVQIVPAAGYVVDTLLDNGIDQTVALENNKYTLSNIMMDHVIDVTFKTTGGADKTKLRAAIIYADSLTSTAYEPATWANLTQALTAAKNVNGNVAADQTAVDNAASDLNEAIHGLEQV